jgi:hypothetical protein
MSIANPLWGAPRIHGELLKVGINIGQTEWIATQITKACGWEQASRYLIRDRDRAYGAVFIQRLRSIGIRDRPSSPRSPRQNGYAERLIGSIRRECLGHCCLRRVPAPSHAAVVHGLFQRDTDAFYFGKRCAGFTRCRTSRANSSPPNSRRATPPIFPNLIYERYRGVP